MKWNYLFDVPEKKKIRLIVNTDCKNEADDQFALAHHFMTPKFMVKGVVACHFEAKPDEGRDESMKKSYDEILKIMDLMGISGCCPVLKGAEYAMPDEKTPVPSEGADFIIREAMKDAPAPLYVAFQGALTDLAAAYLKEPRIAGRMTAIWIGGGKWPVGGPEFNLWQDIAAANVVFGSKLPLWQIPEDVYKLVRVTLAELQLRVRPYGKIGEYLFRQMVEFNDRYGEQMIWPHGESWGLGDQGTVSVLVEEHRHDWRLEPAPLFSKEMFYIHNQNNRPIRVYHNIDACMTLEDFYSKLALNFPKE